MLINDRNLTFKFLSIINILMDIKFKLCFIMSNLSWLKNCKLQRDVNCYSRYEWDGYLLIVNSLTNKYTKLDRNCTIIWEVINGKLTTLQLLENIVSIKQDDKRLEKGREYLKSIEFLFNNKFLYIIENNLTEIIAENFKDWKIYTRPSIKWRWETPDILYLFETSPPKKESISFT